MRTYQKINVMTSLSINTSNTNVSTILSAPASSFGKKSNNLKSLYSYSVLPKIRYRKATMKFTSADWDVNRNELEFE